MRKLFKFLAFLGGLLVVAMGLFADRFQLKQSPPPKLIPSIVVRRRGVAERVIDGDTIVLESGEIIRYLGIDAPEKNKPFFTQAKEKNEELIGGQEVELELDVQEKDKYGRTLAYIWLEEKMINLELAKLDYIEILVFPPNLKYRDEFLKIKKD